MVVGQWLVVISGRNGLFAHYTNVSNIASLSACKPVPWSAFNIAELHNRYYAGTPQAFSNATVAGTGGGDETTGYMGAILASDARGIVICYDRTVSHAQADEIVETTMHYNTICKIVKLLVLLSVSLTPVSLLQIVSRSVRRLEHDHSSGSRPNGAEAV